MTISTLEFRQKLASAYPNAHIEVEDISGGCGASYEVLIVSGEFEGLTTLKRHRQVNSRLQEEIAGLHAFTQKTYTPEQYAKLAKK